MALGLLLAGCGGGQAVRYVATSRPIAQKIPIVCVDKDDKFTEKTARRIERVNLGLQSLKKRRQTCGRR